MWTIILLLIANVFMTFAWYGHLRYPNAPIWMAVILSWSIAFFEYCFQVPANRLGSNLIGAGKFSTAQLKTIQEVITLVVFCFFSVFILKEQLRWNYLVGFGFMAVGVFFVFKQWAPAE
jgi:uncharacterized protein